MSMSLPIQKHIKLINVFKIVLKFHIYIWIPHLKIADLCFLSELSPFVTLCTFYRVKFFFYPRYLKNYYLLFMGFIVEL